MAKYQVSESNFVSAKDVQGVDGVTLEILTEVQDVTTDFGVKPRCKVNVTNGQESHEKLWNLNQQNVNFLVGKFGDESTNWIGKKVSVFTETIKGNLAIRIKEAS